MIQHVIKLLPAHWFDEIMGGIHIKGLKYILFICSKKYKLCPCIGLPDFTGSAEPGFFAHLNIQKNKVRHSFRGKKLCSGGKKEKLEGDIPRTKIPFQA